MAAALVATAAQNLFNKSSIQGQWHWDHAEKDSVDNKGGELGRREAYREKMKPKPKLQMTLETIMVQNGDYTDCLHNE